jgi:hypothetical protein
LPWKRQSQRKQETVIAISRFEFFLLSLFSDMQLLNRLFTLTSRFLADVMREKSEQILLRDSSATSSTPPAVPKSTSSTNLLTFTETQSGIEERQRPDRDTERKGKKRQDRRKRKERELQKHLSLCSLFSSLRENLFSSHHCQPLLSHHLRTAVRAKLSHASCRGPQRRVAYLSFT